MKHPSQQQWIDFLYEESDPAAKADLTEHLRNCSACAEQLANCRATLSQLDQWKLPSAAPRRAFLLQPVWRWAAAAALVLTTGFAAGRLGAASFNSKEAQARRANQVQNELRRGLQQSFKTELATAVENARKEMLTEISTNMDETSRKVLAEAAAISKKQIESLTAALGAVRDEDRKVLLATIQEMEDQRVSLVRLRSDLETVALKTHETFRETQRQLVQLAGFNSTTPGAQQ